MNKTNLVEIVSAYQTISNFESKLRNLQVQTEIGELQVTDLKRVSSLGCTGYELTFTLTANDESIVLFVEFDEAGPISYLEQANQIFGVSLPDAIDTLRKLDIAIKNVFTNE